MNGATAELCAKIIRILSKSRITMIGANQKRLRVFKKSQNSFTMDNFAIFPSKLLLIPFFR